MVLIQEQLQQQLFTQHFIDTESLKVKSTRSTCDPYLLDLAYAEPNKMFTNDFGIGYSYQIGTNPYIFTK